MRRADCTRTDPSPDRGSATLGRRDRRPQLDQADPVRVAGAAAGARVDLTPLRTSRDFRTLFFSGSIFYLGAIFGYVAVPYQLYQLTGSNLAVGAMGLVQLIPLIVFGLYGGALADHVDRGRLQLLTGAAQAALVAVLFGNALLDEPRTWVLYVVGALLSVASALQRPSREALIPRVVKHEELPAAVAVSGLGGQLGMLIGPGIGGLLIAAVRRGGGVRHRSRRHGGGHADAAPAAPLSPGRAEQPTQLPRHHRRHPVRRPPQGPAGHVRS